MRILKLTVLYLIAIIAHWWCGTYCSAYGLSPCIVFVMAVCVATMCGTWESYAFGFFSGLYLDFTTVFLFGGHALTFTMVVYIILFFRRRMDFSGILTKMFLTYFMSLFSILFYELLGLIFIGKLLCNGWTYILLIPFINSIISPFCFFIVDNIKTGKKTQRPKTFFQV